MNSNQKDIIIQDALKITKILNMHLAEDNCIHKIHEIAKEIFE